MFAQSVARQHGAEPDHSHCPHKPLPGHNHCQLVSCPPPWSRGPRQHNGSKHKTRAFHQTWPRAHMHSSFRNFEIAGSAHRPTRATGQAHGDTYASNGGRIDPAVLSRAVGQTGLLSHRGIAYKQLGSGRNAGPLSSKINVCDDDSPNYTSYWRFQAGSFHWEPDQLSHPCCHCCPVDGLVSCCRLGP